MNLYKFHDKPETLDHHDLAHNTVLNLFWEIYKDNPAELEKREAIIARNAEYSYLYAGHHLNGPFKLGEPAIATSARYSYAYAYYILKGLFKLGEAAIATEAEYSYDYAKYVLEGPFKLGEAAIATNALWSYSYAKYVLKGPFKLGEPTITKSEYSKEYNKFIASLK